MTASEGIEDRPELVNEQPYGEGWLVVVELAGEVLPDDLLDADEYRTFVEVEQG